MNTIKKKLRVLLFSDCNRRCKGCCNKDWDLPQLPVVTDYVGYSCIMLTGGEPMLYPELIKKVVADIRAQTDAPIYVYTAKADNIAEFLSVLDVVDGITLTLHAQKDVMTFIKLNDAMQMQKRFSQYSYKSLRLNVFSHVSIEDVLTGLWTIKSGIKWIKDCPLPEDEVFMQLDPKLRAMYSERNDE